VVQREEQGRGRRKAGVLRHRLSLDLDDQTFRRLRRAARPAGPYTPFARCLVIEALKDPDLVTRALDATEADLAASEARRLKGLRAHYQS